MLQPTKEHVTGILHVYHPGRALNLFELLPSFQGGNVTPPKHVLLFIGGLYDNFSGQQYVPDLAALFPLHEQQTWRVMHVQLSSHGRAWGVSSIDGDVEEVAVCIEYIRGTLCKNEDTDIVLMGHSTGCQDIMRYLTSPNPLDERKSIRPVVQGAILQAPVSDRDAALHVKEEGPEVKKAFDRANQISKDTAPADARDTILPMNTTKLIWGPTPVSVARWLSLVSPDSPENPSIEDFFSNDLSDDSLRKTFGTIGSNRLLVRSSGVDSSNSPCMLVLMSDSDEFARRPGQAKSLERWRAIVNNDTGATIFKDSAVILNAVHDVGGDDWPSQEARLVVLRKKVMDYLQYVVGDVDEEARKIWQTDYQRVMGMKQDDGRNVEDKVGVLKL